MYHSTSQSSTPFTGLCGCDWVGLRSKLKHKIVKMRKTKDKTNKNNNTNLNYNPRSPFTLRSSQYQQIIERNSRISEAMVESFKADLERDFVAG